MAPWRIGLDPIRPRAAGRLPCLLLGLFALGLGRLLGDLGRLGRGGLLLGLLLLRALDQRALALLRELGVVILHALAQAARGRRVLAEALEVRLADLAHAVAAHELEGALVGQ